MAAARCDVNALVVFAVPGVVAVVASAVVVGVSVSVLVICDVAKVDSFGSYVRYFATVRPNGMSCFSQAAPVGVFVSILGTTVAGTCVAHIHLVIKYQGVYNNM